MKSLGNPFISKVKYWEKVSDIKSMREYRFFEKLLLAIAVFMVTVTPLSAQSGSPFYTGSGGRGKSITILPPKAVGLAADEAYIPGVVQGELVSNFSGYSAISVLDRMQLDNQYAELLSGYYDDNAQASMDLGHLAPTEYLLVGNITRTATGYALQIQITNTADKTTAVSYSGTCSFAELETLSGVRRASLDLLQKLGVQPTERAKTELGQAAAANQAAAQVALSRGIEAMKKGTVVEALSYFIQSSSADPSLAEAASRVNITSSNITSGNIGADARNAIAWRKAWVARLAECDQWVADYVKNTPLATYLVYSTDLERGEIDWDKETLPISFDIALTPDKSWPAPITGVVDAVYAGLAGTGQAGTWKIGWPAANAAGTARPVFDRNDKTPLLAETSAKFDVVVQLLNEQSEVIGSQTVPLSAGWKAGFNNGKASVAKSQTSVTVTFPTVDANKITDKLTIKVASLNETSNPVVVNKNLLASVYSKAKDLGIPASWLTDPKMTIIYSAAQAFDVPAEALMDAIRMDGTSVETVAKMKSVSIMSRAAYIRDVLGFETANGMVRLKGRTFTMGASRSVNEPQHQVTVSAFWIGQYEVTQKEYRALMGTNPSKFKGDNLPVETVTWYDAVNYCNARSKKEGLTPAYTVSRDNITWNRNANGYRLPTEAEWEYACRAGTTMAYAFGDSISTSDANYYDHHRSGGGSKPVGSYRPNDWGLYDMHGNVWEWCWDWSGQYSSDVQTDPTRITLDPKWKFHGSRVLRGGWWVRFGRLEYLTSTQGGSRSPSSNLWDDSSPFPAGVVGFRLVRNAEGVQYSPEGVE